MPPDAGDPLVKPGTKAREWTIMGTTNPRNFVGFFGFFGFLGFLGFFLKGSFFKVWGSHTSRAGGTHI